MTESSKPRTKCVVCGEEQTDVEFKTLLEKPGISIGFPICDQHQVGDLIPDQYVFDTLIVEVL